MFHRYGKKLKSSPSLKDLTRVVPATLMLAEEKRETLMRQIRASSALEEARFDSLCLSLVHNLINHCQQLPEVSTSYYAQSGGMLDYALNRTEAALTLFKSYLVSDSGTQLSEEQKLWQYALFSAAILKGIGKLQIDYTVNIYDNNGQFLKQWNPLLENLTSLGHHYSYELEKASDEEFRCRLNLLIARLLMPASGFAWIASNPQVLAVWLALLNEDIYAAGTLGAILVHADAIAIQRYFNLLMLKAQSTRGGRYGRANTFTGANPGNMAEIEQQIGMEFIQWLYQSLDAGRIMINKAPLYMVPGGFLMTAEMFQLFVREHPEYKNWQAIQKSFLSLGLHRVGPDGVTTQFEQNSNQQMHTGIIFSHYAIALPPEVRVHNMHTGKFVTMNATEFNHQAKFNSSYFTLKQTQPAIDALPSLRSNGEWQVTEQPVSLSAVPVPLRTR